MHYSGEIVALTTAVLWAFTGIFFTIGTKRAGVIVVNQTRLLAGVLMLGSTHLVLEGTFLPAQAEPWRWAMLALSGFIGLVAGDGMLFFSFAEIGPRKALLLMSTAPVIGAVFAWILLNEPLSWAEGLGILVTMAGVAWVALERSTAPQETKSGRLWLGLSCAFGGAACQALGIVVAKGGMEGGFSPLSATLIRMASSALILWTVTGLRGKLRGALRPLRDAKTTGAILAGAFVGPYLGVWGSLYAVSHAKVGVATALMSLVPVFIIPLVVVFFREKVTWRAILGTLVAFAGMAVLFLA